jgi:hypothetical protein
MRTVFMLLGFFCTVGLWGVLHFENSYSTDISGELYLGASQPDSLDFNRIEVISYTPDDELLSVRELHLDSGVDTLTTVPLAVTGDAYGAVCFEHGSQRYVALGALQRTYEDGEEITPESLHYRLYVVDLTSGELIYETTLLEELGGDSSWYDDDGWLNECWDSFESYGARMIISSQENGDEIIYTGVEYENTWGYGGRHIYSVTIPFCVSYDDSLAFTINGTIPPYGSGYSSSAYPHSTIFTFGVDFAITWPTTGVRYYLATLPSSTSSGLICSGHFTLTQDDYEPGFIVLLNNNDPPGHVDCVYALSDPNDKKLYRCSLAHGVTWGYDICTGPLPVIGSTIITRKGHESLLMVWPDGAYQLRDRNTGLFEASDQLPFITPSNILAAPDGSIYCVETYDNILSFWHGRLDDVATSDTSAPILGLCLEQNAPNPFNPVTRIDYALAAPGTAKLAVYDLRGRLVRTLTDGEEAAGPHHAEWNGVDANGMPVASGVYLYRLESAGNVLSRKCLLMK